MTAQDPAEQLAWWADEARAATAMRNDWIRAMREAGTSLRQIAEAAGMSPAGVAKILK